MTTPYHRLYRDRPNYAWWRPLLAVILAGVLVLSASSVIGIAALLSLTATQGEFPSQAQVEALLVPDAANPLSIVLALAAVAIWLPIFFFSLWAVGLRPTGMLSSTSFRLRWSRITQYGGAALVLVASAQGLGLILLGLTGNLPADRVALEPHIVALSILAVILLVPFQAAAEEYAFRGILLQTLGSWIRNPILPILIPTLLFTLSHIYNLWGLAEVLVLGLTAGWLTVRTGGLEAAIAIHVVNNVLVFLLLIFGVFGTTAIDPNAGSPVSLAVTVAMLALYVVWVLRLERRAT